MKHLVLSDVKQAASSLEGRTLETHHRRRQFHLKVEPEGLFYTPESSGKGRLQEWKYIQRVLDRFNETGSLSPSEYKDMSMNASYLLTVIRVIEK